MRRRSAAGLLAAGVVGVLPLAGTAVAGVLPSAYAADGGVCSEADIPGTEVLADSTERDNPPLERMHVPQAQEVTDGSGVGVAVIDSGVAAGLGIDLAAAVALPDAGGPLLSGHGTIVAGLIAGPEGVAPGARVIDVRVFDTSPADVSQQEKDVTSQGIADGIDQAIALHRTNPFEVVNIALSVTKDDPNLRRAVKELLELDVVVVASAGNAAEPSETFKGTPDNDASVYPADYPGVLAVSAAPPLGGSAIGSTVPNLDTDLAAPTVDALSVNANGQRCHVDQLATSWAAAEVSGVVALLRAHYPRDTPQQTVARLMATTEGSESATNPWTGAGVVQAHDALTRSLDPRRNGRIERSVSEDRRDSMPPPPPARLDLFGSSRALLLWGGLAGGALLALAFMLRSLTRR
ncbi:S8 family serine peptidase [Nocardioides sp. CF8]|uniref:S8 family serine peptidase n=1 Tax=Nocardioides sp. CF8 TaxID=110319 RepID=UPI0003F52EB7|nr:S8 family serine peptidase [Nocardioides sp. CF8]